MRPPQAPLLTQTISGANFHGTMSAIERAVGICEGQAKLGAAIGVSQARISQWIKGELIPLRYFPRIVQATTGQVTAHELLDDELAKIEQLPEAV